MYTSAPFILLNKSTLRMLMNEEKVERGAIGSPMRLYQELAAALTKLTMAGKLGLVLLKPAGRSIAVRSPIRTSRA